MFNTKTKILRLSALSLAVAGAMSVTHTANAEGVDVSGSVGVANMYLWRGYDLGGSEGGLAAVSGDLKASVAGLYGGIWGSSGDATYGTEYDLYVGYGAEFGGFSVDLSLWNYIYPSSESDDTPNVADDFGGLSDAILTLGFGGVSLGIYNSIAGGSHNDYYTLSYSYESFSVLVGKHDREANAMTGLEENADTAHVNISYAYNDNLSFTISQQVDQKTDDDMLFVAAYSLPIGD